MVKKENGFTLVELLIVIVILAFISIASFLVLRNILGKGGDAARKAEISQIGRVLTVICYLPDGGSGQYDLIPLLEEIFSKKPQYQSYIRRIPKDPKVGTDTFSGYTYTVSSDGKKCTLFANLENKNEPVTLPDLGDPTPGGGSGVLKGETTGANGTQIYFQVSN